MKQGPHLSRLLDMVDRGMDVPPSAYTPPELGEGLSFFMDAWRELASCRNAGGRIPWTAVDRWCEVYGIRGEQREDLWFHVQGLDVVYSEFQENSKGSSGGDK